MRCPVCGSLENTVKDSRTIGTGEVRRRRACLNCRTRYSTLESVVSVDQDRDVHKYARDAELYDAIHQLTWRERRGLLIMLRTFNSKADTGATIGRSRAVRQTDSTQDEDY